jgi:hypothetical protein
MQAMCGTPVASRKSFCVGGYPLVMANIAIENGHLEIVSFPIKNGDFP